MDPKAPWLSKTLWFNLAVAVAALVSPQVSQTIANHPDWAALAVTVVNIGLRLITKSGIQIS